LSPLTLLLWLAFAALAIALPGVALQRFLGTRIDPSLVVPLGTAWCAGCYWLSLASGHASVFPASIVLAGVALLTRGVRFDLAPGPSLRGAIAPILGLVAFLALTQYRFNREGPSGDFLLDPLVTFDSAFHVGLTHELVVGRSPQVPGVAGFPLGYHLGTDLVRAAALRWAGTDPWDSITRLDVTLWALALVLALRTLTARLGVPRLAVAVVPWTLLLGDFSFLLAGNPQAHWWTDLFRGNILLSLVYANPLAPALALALGALISLSRYTESGRAGHAALAALQAAAVPAFKVFLGAHLLLGMGTAFLLARPRQRRVLAIVAVPCAAATAALALGQGGETVRVLLAPLDLARTTRAVLGLPALHGAALLAWGLLWIVVSLGLRVLGLKSAASALRGPVAGSALAAMALAGWPLGLLFRVSAPEVLAGQRFVNDAGYLLEQSGPLLWIFTAITVSGIATTRVRQVVALGGALLLAAPASVEYAVEKLQIAPDRIPAPMVRAMHALVAVSKPGDVVIQRPGGALYPAAPVVLAGRRVTYERFTPYLTQFVSREDLEARHLEVYRFFRTRDRDEALAIARRLHASFLALYGHDRVRFDTRGALEPVYEQAQARVYRIRYAAGAARRP
jgi:hypothetical protein